MLHGRLEKVRGGTRTGGAFLQYNDNTVERRWFRLGGTA
jgi:hypothetical protein